MKLPNFLKSPASRVPRWDCPKTEIIEFPDPDEVIIPLEYPGQILFQPLVEEGDRVARNQPIGRSEFGNFVHASISGRVKEIRLIWSARSFRVPALVIEKGDAPALAPGKTLSLCGLDPASATRLDLLRAGGVVSPWTLPGPDRREGGIDDIPEIRHLVIWALGEEPTIFNYETLLGSMPEAASDWIHHIREMAPSAEVSLLVRLSHETWVRKLFPEDVRIIGIPDSYRDRIERVVIPRVTGIEVPNTKSYIDYGIAVMSLEEVQASHEAFLGRPWIRKTVTLAGYGFEEPVTLRAPLGTPIRVLLESRGLTAPPGGRVLFGGPMKGYAQFSDDTPLCKFHHGVFLIGKDQLPSEVNLTCVNCGRCTEACPAHLQVHLIARSIEFDLILEARAYHPEACHDCGLCAFVCPSHRPLVQLVKIAKKYGA